MFTLLTITNTLSNVEYFVQKSAQKDRRKLCRHKTTTLRKLARRNNGCTGIYCERNSALEESYTFSASKIELSLLPMERSWNQFVAIPCAPRILPQGIYVSATSFPAWRIPCNILSRVCFYFQTAPFCYARGISRIPCRHRPSWFLTTPVFNLSRPVF